MSLNRLTCSKTDLKVQLISGNNNILRHDVINVTNVGAKNTSPKGSNSREFDNNAKQPVLPVYLQNICVLNKYRRFVPS